MAARENDIVADEMDDQTRDQTGQNSTGQVSNYRGQPKAGTGLKMLFVPFVFSKSRSENKVHTFTNSKFKTLFQIKRIFPNTPVLAKLQNG